METLRDFFERSFLSNPLWAWLLALAVSAVVFTVVATLRRILFIRAKAFAERKRDGFLAVLPRLAMKISILVALALALAAASVFLVLPAAAEKVIRVVVVIALAVQALLWTTVLIDFAIAEFQRRHKSPNEAENASLATSMWAVRIVGLILVYSTILLLALQNLGVDVTAMIAGLGVGGIAVALAVQNILGDLFASLSIVLDKPFVVGDFIIVGDKLGTVEKIGIKTTRIRALSGEQLVFSNSDLLNSRIQNFKRMNERRIVFSFGVQYDTPLDLLQQMPGIVRKAIEDQPRTRIDRAHFKAFGPSSLDFEAVYFMLVPDFGAYMDTQQAINFQLLQRFRELGISFAFPTTTLHVASLPPDPPPRKANNPA